MLLFCWQADLGDPTHPLAFRRKDALAKNSHHWFGVELDTESTFSGERNGEKARGQMKLRFLSPLECLLIVKHDSTPVEGGEYIINPPKADLCLFYSPF